MNDKDWMKETLQDLKRLRDEIRLDLHLGSMEAKDRWKALEPTFREAERLANGISAVSKSALGEIVENVRRFRDSVRKQAAEQRDAKHAT